METIARVYAGTNCAEPMEHQVLGAFTNRALILQMPPVVGWLPLGSLLLATSDWPTAFLAHLFIRL